MKTRVLPLLVLASSLYLLTAAEPDKSLAAHEWGTFTSAQGADGVQAYWSGPVSADLPAFVYRSTTVGSKALAMSRQRMETPVIYFYSDRERTVDVTVHFPEGQITEWYPQKTAALRGRVQTVQDAKQPVLRWPNVRILPQGQAQGNLPLPSDASGSHYYAARETDASLLRVPAADGQEKSETEKFLFYRGTANFAAPLTVKSDPTDPKLFHLTNTGREEIHHLFLYDRDAAGAGLWMTVHALAPGETRSVRLDINSGAQPITAADLSLDKAALVSSPRLGSKLVGTLAEEGLYEKEATAMVKTWESSWFAEQGTRVLYTLPRAWTDRTLPLKITPAPREITRVMIGRAEIITPARELALLQQIERYIAAPESQRPAIVQATRSLGLGRFAETALLRILGKGERGPDFAFAAQTLIHLASTPVPPPAPPKTTAAN